MSRATAFLLALIASAAARPARALDVWKTPHPGVRHLRRVTGPFDYHVLLVDLANPRVTFLGTDEATTLPRREPRPRFHLTRTSTFADDVGADVAINANYFDVFTLARSTCGLTATRGRPWRTSYQDPRLDCFDSVAFGADGAARRVAFFDSRDVRPGAAAALPAPWMDVVLTGSPRLLRDGEVVHATHPRHALFRNPRTAVGLSRDGGTLYVMVVNGREGRAQGMTCVEAARALRALGAHDAVNLDGGGSSSLFVRAEGGIVSHTGDRVERPVSNHFGIAFRAPRPEPPAPPAPRAPGALVARDAAQPPAAARARVAPRDDRAAPGSTLWSALVVAGVYAVARTVRRRRDLTPPRAAPEP